MSSNHDSDPWAAPAGRLTDDHSFGIKPEGNYAAGFFAGLLCGCIGLLVVLIAASGERTKQGALAGFGVGIVAGIVLRLLEFGLSQ